VIARSLIDILLYQCCAHLWTETAPKSRSKKNQIFSCNPGQGCLYLSYVSHNTHHQMEQVKWTNLQNSLHNPSHLILPRTQMANALFVAAAPLFVLFLRQNGCTVSAWCGAARVVEAQWETCGGLKMDDCERVSADIRYTKRCAKCAKQEGEENGLWEDSMTRCPFHKLDLVDISQLNRNHKEE